MTIALAASASLVLLTPAAAPVLTAAPRPWTSTRDPARPADHPRPSQRPDWLRAQASALLDDEGWRLALVSPADDPPDVDAESFRVVHVFLRPIGHEPLPAAGATL